MAELRYVDWDGLVYYDGKIKEFIRDKAEDYLKMGGVLSIKDLPDPSWQNLNYIYKITDKFTSNNRFEVPGLVYEPGTWVQCASIKNDERFLYIIFNEESIGETADIDLSDYYTKSEVDNKIDQAIDAIELPDTSSLITRDELETLTEDFVIQSDIEVVNNAVAEVQTQLEDKADKNDLNGLASEDYVDQKIKQIPSTDLSNYYEKSEVDNLIPDVSNFVTKEEFLDVQQQSAENEVKISAIDSELSDIKSQLETIPTKVSDLENDAKYATEDFVRTEIAKAELNGGEVTDEELNQLLSNYYKKTETYSKTEVDDKIPDISGLATNDKVAAVEAKVDDIVIPEVPTKVSQLENDTGYVTAAEIPETDLSNYYNKEEVDQKLSEIEHPTVDLGGYATEKWVNEQGFIKEVPDEYITESELNNKGYLTEHQDLSEYAKKSDIPDVSNFVTTDTVNNILSTKADDIPFTTDKVVTNAVGQFALNDSVKGLTIAQILTKILGLVDYTEPEVPTSLVEKILVEQTPMYAINDEGSIIEVPFRIVNAEDDPTQSGSGFYYIEQDGKIVEGGYQEQTINNQELYYMIALPKEIDYNTMIKLQSWDPVNSEWIDSEMPLTSDPEVVRAACEETNVDISHIDSEKYTVWLHEAECTGSILRYIIKEEA